MIVVPDSYDVAVMIVIRIVSLVVTVLVVSFVVTMAMAIAIALSPRSAAREKEYCSDGQTHPLSL